MQDNELTPARDGYLEAESQFVRIYQLLRLNGYLHIPRIAHHLLNGGAVWGVDRYGRNRRFTLEKDPKEIQTLLDLLAKQFESEQWFLVGQGHPDELPPLDNCELGTGSHPFDWGWDPAKPNNDMPDFDKMSPHEVEFKAEPKSESPKQVDNLHRIIGALLLYIKGENGLQKHPAYDTQSELIATLEKVMDGYAGIKKRNLEGVFAKANKLLDTP